MLEPGPEFQPERPRAGCGAVALMALGLLILIPSGLCTGALTIFPLLGALSGNARGSDASQMIGMALTIGGPFIIVGAVLTWLGVRLKR